MNITASLIERFKKDMDENWGVVYACVPFNFQDVVLLVQSYHKMHNMFSFTWPVYNGVAICCVSAEGITDVQIDKNDVVVYWDKIYRAFKIGNARIAAYIVEKMQSNKEGFFVIF